MQQIILNGLRAEQRIGGLLSKMREIVIKSGTYFDVARDYAITTLNSLLPEKSWVVSIKERQKRRTPKQRRSIFGPAYEAIMNATGYTKDEVHDWACKTYFGTKDVDIFGDIIKVPVRTTTINEEGKYDEISIEEHSQMYLLIQQKMAAMGIYVPDPGEHYDGN